MELYLVEILGPFLRKLKEEDVSPQDLERFLGHMEEVLDEVVLEGFEAGWSVEKVRGEMLFALLASLFKGMKAKKEFDGVASNN